MAQSFWLNYRSMQRVRPSLLSLALAALLTQGVNATTGTTALTLSQELNVSKTTSEQIKENCTSSQILNSTRMFSCADFYQQQLDILAGGLNFEYNNSFLSHIYQANKAVQLKEMLLANRPRKGTNHSLSSNTPVKIIADQVEVLQNGTEIIFTGNVKMFQGDRIVNTDYIRYYINEQKETFLELPQVSQLEDELYIVSAQKISSVYANDQVVVLEHGHFVLKDSILDGYIDHVNKTNDKIYFNGLHFNSGASHPAAWHLYAKSGNLDLDSNQLTLNHTYLTIGKVPFFYLPTYLLNTTGEMVTGWQIPVVDLTNALGLKFGVPYFYRFNKQNSVLITPSYTTKKETFLDANYTRVTDTQNQWVNLAVARSLRSGMRDLRFAAKAGGSFFTNDDYRNLTFEYNHISDPYFINDFYGDTSKYLTNKIEASYYGDSFDWSLASYKFLPINGNEVETYNVVPEIRFNYSPAFQFNKLLWNLRSEFSRFTLFNKSSELLDYRPLYTQTFRSYVYGGAKYAFQNHYFDTELDLGIHDVIYILSNLYSTNKSIHRYLPESRISFSSNFYDFNSLKNYFIQLRPFVGYTYRYASDYAQDRELVNFDSVLLQANALNIRYNTSSRLIDSLSPLSVANLTFDFNLNNKYDASEVISGSVGVQKSFGARANQSVNYLTTNEHFNVSSDLHLNVNKYVNIDFSGVFDLTAQNSNMGLVSLSFKPNETNQLQLSYRYATQSYINRALLNDKVYQPINQVGMAALVDINARLSMLMQNYFDLGNNRFVNHSLGFQYTYPGWSLGVHLERVLVDGAQFDNRFNLNFELLGIGYKLEPDLSKFINAGVINFVGR